MVLITQHKHGHLENDVLSIDRLSALPVHVLGNAMTFSRTLLEAPSLSKGSISISMHSFLIYLFRF